MVRPTEGARVFAFQVSDRVIRKGGSAAVTKFVWTIEKSTVEVFEPSLSCHWVLSLSITASTASSN
jgi:hypothetical protein